MATEIPLPATDENLDVSEPSSAAMTGVLVTVGLGLMFVMINFGQRIGNIVTEQIDEVMSNNESQTDEAEEDLVVM